MRCNHGSTQQCSNLYCHGASMTPNADCLPAPSGPMRRPVLRRLPWRFGCQPPTRGAHVKHASSFRNGYEFACTLCHVNYATQHVDNQSQVAFSSTPGNNGATPARPRCSMRTELQQSLLPQQGRRRLNALFRALSYCGMGRRAMNCESCTAAMRRQRTRWRPTCTAAYQ